MLRSAGYHPFTFVATATDAHRSGHFRRYRSCWTFIAPDLIEKAITEKTRSILPVHLFGLAAELRPIKQIADDHSLTVIEDAAQAIGATYRGQKVGSIGNFGCFSFFPSKNLGCAGDGGMVTARERAMADQRSARGGNITRKSSA